MERIEFDSDKLLGVRVCGENDRENLLRSGVDRDVAAPAAFGVKQSPPPMKLGR